MAERSSFPQIPARVWWGVRDLIHKSPSTKFDDNNLSVSLEVQPAASRQYLSELKRIGILNEDGSVSGLGMKWRIDDNYDEVIDEILKNTYPQGLIGIAPSGSADRNKVERWFTNHGLGAGSARNKAATYVMIANDRPGEIKVRAASNSQSSGATERKKQQQTERKAKSPPTSQNNSSGSSAKTDQALMPLNVNVQIHISAEASSEQIESIFSSMRKYLYNETPS